MDVAGFAATIAAAGNQTKLITWHDNVPGLTSDLPSPGRMLQLQAQLVNVVGTPAELRVQLFADNQGAPGIPLTEVVGLPIAYADDPTQGGALASVDLLYMGPVWARVSFDNPAGEADLTFCAWAEGV